MAGEAWRAREGRPRIIGHRGAAALAPENTLAALRAARALGMDGVECDARATADGRLVVFHDRDLVRLTGRPGRVERTPLGALREIRVGAEPIPTLDEWLEEAGDLPVNIEIKHDGAGLSGRCERAVADAIARHGAAGGTLVSSFSPWVLARFRAAAPSVPIGLLFEDTAGGRLVERARALLGPFSIHPPHALVDAARMARWRRARLAVIAWTVDDRAEAARLGALGVDGIITNGGFGPSAGRAGAGRDQAGAGRSQFS